MNITDQIQTIMKRTITKLLFLMAPLAALAQGEQAANVYFTSDISSESLVRIYRAVASRPPGGWP